MLAWKLKKHGPWDNSRQPRKAQEGQQEHDRKAGSSKLCAKAREKVTNWVVGVGVVSQKAFVLFVSVVSHTSA